MCSKLKISTAWHRSGVFVVDFDQSQHIDILFLLLTLNKYLSLVCEKQVIIFWKHTKKIHLFCNKIYKSYFIQRFIIALNWNNYNHIMNILWTYVCFVSKFSLGIPSVSSSFRLLFDCYIIALFQRFNLYHCIKPKAYFNHWSSGTNW